jgi:hypothetical protein
VIEHGGPFGEGAPDYARERVAALAKYTVRPILFAKVRLIRHVEPAAVVAKGTVDVDGEVSFAQAHGLSPREAIDLMVDQLRKEITEQSGSRSALGRRSPEE